MNGAPECGMKAAAGRCFSGPAAARLAALLCCLIVPHSFLSATQAPQTSPPQQTPAAQPSPEISTTQQAAPAAPAPADAVPEVNTHSSTPFESRVNLVPVRVVVHDSNGKAVPGLTKEDFRLFQDRRRQTISLFTVETPPLTERRRRWATDRSTRRVHSRNFHFAFAIRRTSV